MLAGIFKRLTGAFRPPVHHPVAASPSLAPRKRTNNGAGGKASVTIERECPHCGKRVKGPGYFRHVNACQRNPARMAGDIKAVQDAAPEPEPMPLETAIAKAAE